MKSPLIPRLMEMRADQMGRFSELSTSDKGAELLRWVLVPIASVAAIVLLILLSRIVIPPAMARPPGSPPPPVSEFRRLAPLVFNGLISVSLVLAGAWTAPRGRLPTALVLAALWIGYAFLIHVGVHLGRGRPNWLHFGLSLAAALAAVALVHYGERARQPRLDTPFAPQ
jgi:hypothetical protein